MENNKPKIRLPESWCMLSDFPNYEISTYGRARNIKTQRILKNNLTRTKDYASLLLMDGKGIGKQKLVHRLVLDTFRNNDENKKCVDHIDGNKLNNNLFNLRYATYQENSRNRKISSDNKCGIKGIYFHKASKKWRAQIMIDNNKRIYLGIFQTMEEAKTARIDAVNKLFGEFIHSSEKA